MTKTVAVIFGGKSTEHDISIVTALSAVIKPLELSGKYKVIPVYISKDGKWYSHDKLKNIELYQDGAENFLQKLKPLSLLFDDGFSLVKLGLKNEKMPIDIIFPAMHGTYGEDGSLQGLIRMANTPFVGCDLAASVVAMDKTLTKQAAMSAGIKTPKSISLDKLSFGENKEELLSHINNELRYPLFVKPAHLGSSIGISQVQSPEELENAIEVALHYDDKGLIEEAVPNLIEVTVPIIGNEMPQPALVEQPLVAAEDFFDFDTKYLNGSKKGGGKKQSGAQGYSNLPAKIPEDLIDESLRVATSMYKATGCQGIARIDLLINGETKEVYFNEINPLPGSLYAHNFRAAGISSIELVEKLIQYAEQAFANRAQLESSFSTNFLQQSQV